MSLHRYEPTSPGQLSKGSARAPQLPQRRVRGNGGRARSCAPRTGRLKVPLRATQGRGEAAQGAALTVSLLAVDHPHQQGRVPGELWEAKTRTRPSLGSHTLPGPARRVASRPPQPDEATGRTSPQSAAGPPLGAGRATRRLYLDEWRDLHRRNHPDGDGAAARNEAQPAAGRKAPPGEGGAAGNTAPCQSRRLGG